MEKKAVVLMGDRKFEAGKVKFCCLWPFRMAFGLLASQPGEASQIITRAREPHNNTGITPSPDSTHATPYRIHQLHPQTIHTIGRDVSHRSFHGMVWYGMVRVQYVGMCDGVTHKSCQHTSPRPLSFSR